MKQGTIQKGRGQQCCEPPPVPASWREAGVPCGLGHLPGHAGIGVLDLLVRGTCVAELIAGVRVGEVAPHTCHVHWDLKAAVLFGCNLERRREEEAETSQAWGGFALWDNYRRPSSSLHPPTL